jgi:hypothetical protein
MKKIQYNGGWSVCRCRLPICIKMKKLFTTAVRRRIWGWERWRGVTASNLVLLYFLPIGFLLVVVVFLSLLSCQLSVFKCWRPVIVGCRVSGVAVGYCPKLPVSVFRCRLSGVGWRVSVVGCWLLIVVLPTVAHFFHYRCPALFVILLQGPYTKRIYLW